VKKFWHRVEAAFKKLFGSSKWEKTTSAVISYIAPLLETLVALTAGGPAAALVTNIVSIAQTDLATLAAVVDGATATPAANEVSAAINALNSIKTNLAALLTAADVKNAATSLQVTATVNAIIGEVEAILANVPSFASTVPSVPAPQAPAPAAKA
jgi:hypothetical protein